MNPFLTNRENVFFSWLFLFGGGYSILVHEGISYPRQELEPALNVLARFSSTFISADHKLFVRFNQNCCSWNTKSCMGWNCTTRILGCVANGAIGRETCIGSLLVLPEVKGRWCSTLRSFSCWVGFPRGLQMPKPGDVPVCTGSYVPGLGKKLMYVLKMSCMSCRWIKLLTWSKNTDLQVRASSANCSHATYFQAFVEISTWLIGIQWYCSSKSVEHNTSF